MSEKIHVTLPLSEYESLKEIEKQVQIIKDTSCYMLEHYSYSSNYTYYKIEVMNYDKLESAAIEQLTKEIEQLKLIKTPTLWHTIKGLINL